MAIQWSVAVRNARLSAISATIGASAILRFYAGPEPANVAAALSGDTLLVEFDLAASWAAAPANGVMGINNTPLQAAAVAGGTASFYRIFASDGTTCHEQGSITVTGGGGDLTLDNTNIATSQLVQVTAFNKTEAGA